MSYPNESHGFGLQDNIWNGIRRLWISTRFRMGWGGYNFDSDRQISSDRVFFVLHCYRGLPSDGLKKQFYFRKIVPSRYWQMSRYPGNFVKLTAHIFSLSFRFGLEIARLTLVFVFFVDLFLIYRSWHSSLLSIHYVELEFFGVYDKIPLEDRRWVSPWVSGIGRI